MNYEVTTDLGLLRQVQAIQDENHKESVGKTDRGFLTLKTDLDFLVEISREVGVIVAVTDDREVVGYDLMISISRAAAHPLYTRMVETYRKQRSSTDIVNFVVSAQYCVKKGHRGGITVRGMFRLESQHLRQLGFETVIGEIDSRNTISLKTAEHLLGYTECGRYRDGETEWIVFEKDLG